MGSDVDPFESARRTAADLSERLGHHDAVLVAGSGWADAIDALGTTSAELRLAELAGVEPVGVDGHRGVARSVAVPLGDGRSTEVLVLAGRIHLYEGHRPDRVVHLVRAAVLSGCSRAVLTNAAGSLRPDHGVGSVVAVADHLNLTGSNPMCGPLPGPELPSRFVDLTDLYSSRWRAELSARRPGIAEGVYAGLLGGSFETPAEIRMLRTLGADLVGMSTVLEAIAARHLGAEVLGLSLVTNLAAGLQQHVDHGEVLAAGRDAAPTLAVVLRDALATSGS